MLVAVIVYFIIRSSKKVDDKIKVFKQYGESDLKGAKDYLSEIRNEREAKEIFMKPKTNALDQSGGNQMDSEISHIFIQSMMNEDTPPHHHIEHHSDHGGGGSFGGGGSTDSWSDNSSSSDYSSSSDSSSSDCGSSSND